MVRISESCQGLGEEARRTVHGKRCWYQPYAEEEFRRVSPIARRTRLLVSRLRFETQHCSVSAPSHLQLAT